MDTEISPRTFEEWTFRDDPRLDPLLSAFEVWPFRDDTRLNLFSTSDDSSKPLRFDKVAGGIVIRTGDSRETLHSEEGEKDPIHHPEKRPLKKWTHEDVRF